MLTRRVFLRGSAVVMAGMGAAPAWLARAAEGARGKRKVLVAIFQRGAADALNIVVPFSEKRYYELRPSIAVQPPSTQSGPNPTGSIDLDGRFALHSGLQPLKSLWDNKQLAIVHATGSPDPSRSHFDAQDYMESGTPGKTSPDGWLNRALSPAGPETSPVRAVSMGAGLPRTLRGQRAAVSVSDMFSLQFGGQDAAGILESMYTGSSDPRLAGAGKSAFDAVKMIQSIGRQQPTPPQAGRPPLFAQGGEFSRSMQQLARLIKADIGVEAAFAEIGGWDHHTNETQQLFNLLRQMSSALDSFTKEMGDRMEDIVLVTMSEFGRTPKENGTNGTDHGHGSMMMVLGGPVQGGQIYGRWPGLEPEQLFEGRDLAVTTDFRDVLGELVAGHLGQTDLGKVFPGFQQGKKLGLLRG